MNEILLEELKKEYDVTMLDIGNDCHLQAGGLEFAIHSYDVKDLGHLCTVQMKGLKGIMKMETAILAAEHYDVPLFNMDRVRVLFNCTQIVELYDNMLKPLSTAAAERYSNIRKAGPKLKEYRSGEHWYDDLLYPFSYAKKKKGSSVVFDDICRQYVYEYLHQLTSAESCDPEEKQLRTAAFAQGLLDNGGAAVNQFRKLFGEETTRRIVLTHMYGIKS